MLEICIPASKDKVHKCHFFLLVVERLKTAVVPPKAEKGERYA